MSNYDDLTNLLKDLLFNRYLPQPQIIKGLLGDGTGAVRVPGRKDFNYARFNRGSSKSFEVFNKTVPEVDGWPVLLSEFPWQPGLVQVVGTDWEAYIQSGWGDSVSTANPHAPTHEWRDKYIGADPLSIYMRSIAPARGYSPNSTGTVVFVNSFEYHTGTIWPGTPGVDLAPLMAAIPTGTARFAGVYVNPNNTLGVVTGATSVDTQAFDPPLVTFPFGTIPIARIRLYGGQGGLKEADFRDARRLFDLPPTGTAGGGAPTGLAGGDLTGSYPDPRVAGLFGYPLVNTAPASGNVLMFTGSAWRPTGLIISALAASDGAPNPAWHVDAGGNLLTDGGYLDMDGKMQILDADGDTYQIADVDDQITVVAGSSQIYTVSSPGIALSSSKDIYPDGDEAGVWARLVNCTFSPLEHFTGGGDEISWTGWASYTGFVTPSVISYANSNLVIANNSAATKAFRYRSLPGSTPVVLRARMAISQICAVGLMLDDGVDDGDGEGATNFYRVLINQAVSAGPVTYVAQSRTGGGAVTTTTSTLELDLAYYHGIQISTTASHWSNWQAIARLFGEDGLGRTMATAASLTWTPTRVGLAFSLGGGLAPLDRIAVTDWYHEATS